VKFAEWVDYGPEKSRVNSGSDAEHMLDIPEVLFVPVRRPYHSESKGYKISNNDAAAADLVFYLQVSNTLVVHFDFLKVWWVS